MGNSLETRCLISVEASQSYLAHLIGSVYRPYDYGSYHAALGTDGGSLAVDFDAPGNNIPQLLAIQNFFWQNFRYQLTELIGPNHDQLVWAHPGRGRYLGRVCVGIYGGAILAQHMNHDHSAVAKGTFVHIGTSSPAPPPPTLPTPVPPTTITTTTIPGEKMIRHDVKMPRLDDKGNGWTIIPNTLESKVVSIIPHGSYPPSDGYWKIPRFAKQQRGSGIAVEVTDGPPLGMIQFSIWVAE